MNSALSNWQQAYHWACARRRHAPPNADIWDLRFHWPQQGPGVFSEVLAGRYRLSPMRVQRSAGRSWVQWSARDALVLKWVALEVQGLLPLHHRCTHVRGHGGRQVLAEIGQAVASGDYPFVYRTDIRGYYRHIRKEQVVALIRRHLGNPVHIGLIEQYLHYSVEDAGEFHTPRYGICRGCALSPLIGATLLHHVDSDLAGRSGILYVRYMDDFLLLSRRRWPLRRAIARLQGYFAEGGFSVHPGKTQLGRTAKGFDWLGAWFTPDGVGIAPRALHNHRERRARLYERAIARGLGRAEALERVRVYEARWERCWSQE
ncbi:hypothetical protein HNP29_004021 [Pseudomonas alcaligenes]|nr:hypothetical protein [Pseudomonas alcaligenes]